MVNSKKNNEEQTIAEEVCEAYKEKIEKADRVVCKMCGHLSKTETGFCEMCTNYLF